MQIPDFVQASMHKKVLVALVGRCSCTAKTFLPILEEAKAGRQVVELSRNVRQFHARLDQFKTAPKENF